MDHIHYLTILDIMKPLGTTVNVIRGTDTTHLVSSTQLEEKSILFL